MSDAENLTQRLNDLIQHIEKTKILLANGEVTPVNNLDQTIASLCADIEQSTPKVAKSVQPLMAQMITKLDELALIIQDAQSKRK